MLQIFLENQVGRITSRLMGFETTNNKNYILHMNGGWTLFLIKNIGVAELRNVPGYGKIENGELNKH
jgi:hypothetical protein